MDHRLINPAFSSCFPSSDWPFSTNFFNRTFPPRSIQALLSPPYIGIDTRQVSGQMHGEIVTTNRGHLILRHSEISRDVKVSR
jgi:hypothetical protein